MPRSTRPAPSADQRAQATLNDSVLSVQVDSRCWRMIGLHARSRRSSPLHPMTMDDAATQLWAPEFWTYFAEGACSGIASAAADACSVAAADASSGSGLAAASANCLRLTHSQTATPIAAPANNTAPTTMDQRPRMLCLQIFSRDGCRYPAYAAGVEPV